MSESTPRGYLGKRTLDLALTLLALPVALPLGAIVGLVVALTMGRPILFRQRRPGLQERLFTLRKFRTMTSAADPDGDLLPDEQRLTAIGRFLRLTSLDELPELYNVLAGEMSWVGPRPLLPRYLPYYRPPERKRFSARPGLTGWAQINGRNRSDWDQRLALDVWYVNNISLLLDLRILALTLPRVLTGADVDLAQSSQMCDLDEARRATIVDSPDG